MMEYCSWLQGRRFQLWPCVRDQTEKIEKTPPPPPKKHILFLFYLFNNCFLFLFFLFVDFFCHVLCCHGVAMGRFLFFDKFF